MSDYRHPYIRLMTDIIDSGVWANLSSAAKTLYPVLLKFSDYSFKPVWPNTETLMRLTGFKTKKSIVQAKKELAEAGLLFHVPGNGRTSTRYHFSFHYEGSKITPLGDKNMLPRDTKTNPSEGDNLQEKGGADVSPNHINITISNTNQYEKPDGSEKKEKEKRTGHLEELIDLFGTEIAFQAYSHAKGLSMENDFGFLRGLCKKAISEKQNEVLSFRQESFADPSLPHPASWLGFLEWASQQLSHSTWKELEKTRIKIDGKVLIVESKVTGFSKQIIQKYFTEKAKPALLILFEEKEEPSRLSEIR